MTKIIRFPNSAFVETQESIEDMERERLQLEMELLKTQLETAKSQYAKENENTGKGFWAFVIGLLLGTWMA